MFICLDFFFFVVIFMFYFFIFFRSSILLIFLPFHFSIFHVCYVLHSFICFMNYFSIF